MLAADVQPSTTRYIKSRILLLLTPTTRIKVLPFYCVLSYRGSSSTNYDYCLAPVVVGAAALRHHLSVRRVSSSRGSPTGLLRSSSSGEGTPPSTLTLSAVEGTPPLTMTPSTVVGTPPPTLPLSLVEGTPPSTSMLLLSLAEGNPPLAGVTITGLRVNCHYSLTITLTLNNVANRELTSDNYHSEFQTSVTSR